MLDLLTAPLASHLARHLQVPEASIVALLMPPAKGVAADIALPCFQLAKAKSVAPPVMASELANVLNASNVGVQAVAAGPFCNLTFTTAGVAGGFFVAHINVVEQAYLKVLLDEIFGRGALVAQISWQRAPDRTLLGQGSALVADQVEYLLCYVKGAVASDWPRPQRRAPLTDKTLGSYGRALHPSPDADLVAEVGGARIYAHRSYRLSTIPARELAAAAPAQLADLMRTTNQQSESSFQHVLLARMPSRDVLYRADYTQARGKHRGPRSRHYLNGNVVLWLRDVAVVEDGRLVRVADLNNFWPADDIPATGIAGEGGVVLRRGKKPERLMERVISAFSRPGDLVLDFFAGSGTTGAVAARLGRRLVLVEADPAQQQLVLARLERAGCGFTAVSLL